MISFLQTYKKLRKIANTSGIEQGLFSPQKRGYFQNPFWG